MKPVKHSRQLSHRDVTCVRSAHVRLQAECKIIRTANTGTIGCTVSANAWCCTPTPPTPKPEYPYGYSGYPYNPHYGKMN